jgi:FkbH-like protein
LSAVALLELSKALGLSYLRALLLPPLKAVVVDLDNTLYYGVLGEDGAAGVILTKNHSRLQRLLVELSQKGILICAATKNNFDDVKQLFAERGDFPLKWDTFAKVCASWEAKSSMIAEIKTYLNINEDSMIFIDDNIGELIEVMSVFPNIKVIQASADAELTHKVLRNFPGIFRFSHQQEDVLRKEDIKANEKRQELQQALPPEAYIKSLNMVIRYRINNTDDISRITELSNKTNQFIFSYKRYSAAEIAGIMKREDAVVVSISLSDRLSDSGLIGACIVEKEGRAAVLEELFISCRALGRTIEDIMILNAVKTALDTLNIYLLKVNFIKGERNLPAELFVKAHLARFLNDADIFDYQNDTDLLEVCVEG